MGRTVLLRQPVSGSGDHPDKVTVRFAAAPAPDACALGPDCASGVYARAGGTMSGNKKARRARSTHGGLSFMGTAGQLVHRRIGGFHWRKVQNLHLTRQFVQVELLAAVPKLHVTDVPGRPNRGQDRVRREIRCPGSWH